MIGGLLPALSALTVMVPITSSAQAGLGLLSPGTRMEKQASGQSNSAEKTGLKRAAKI
jgi:hypothetical protein